MNNPAYASTLNSTLADQGFEFRRVFSELTRTEFDLRGGRFHLLLLLEGGGILIDEQGERPLLPRSIGWLPNGRPRSVRLDAGTTGILTSIPDTILGKAIANDVLGTQMRHVAGLAHHFQQVEKSLFKTLLYQAELVENELQANRPGLETVLQNSVSIMLVGLWRLSGADTMQPLPVPRNLVHSFASLLDVHLRDHWSVARYASHMGISRDRLTSVLRRATGKTPLALIHGKMMEEAKVLLTASNQQVAEIAYTLGFTDPAYFNRFFQRYLGITPARYRREHRRRELDEDESFAAWP